MSNARVLEMARKAREGVLDYGPDRSRLLLRLMRRLAQGRPVTAGEVNEAASELGLPRDETHPFLQTLTQQNAEGQIVDIMGLSLRDSPHRLYVNGVALSAWCAVDTLFLPAMLQQTATVESHSPLSKETIRLTVSPERVEAVSPPGAVLSVVVIDPTEESMASVVAIWTNFCNHIYFFASREEAEQWAAGKAAMRIAILTMEEGFELGQELWSKVLSYNLPQPASAIAR